MKVFGWILFLGCMAAVIYFFRDDLFSDGGGEEGRGGPPSTERSIPIRVKGTREGKEKVTEAPSPSTDRGGESAGNAEGVIGRLAPLMGQGKWDEALALLEGLGDKGKTPNLLAARHRCLVALKRKRDAQAVLVELLKVACSAPVAVSAVLDAAEGGMLSALEVRKAMAAAASAFEMLPAGEVPRLSRVMKKVNADLPASVKGVVPLDRYTIRPNDSLWNICKRYNREKNLDIAVGLVARLNGLRSEIIHPGDELLIPTQRVSVKIWRKNWLLAVFIGSVPFAVYPVGLGMGESTPTGDFVIKTRLKNPDWYSEKLGRLVPFGDKENILGTRWMGFENKPNARGLGIHGTSDPSSIGKNLSSGCIRLANEDVETLFDIVWWNTPVKVL